MAEKIANIAKNTSYFTMALILQKAISLVYFTLYARQLGAADLGKYYFAISFTTIFSIALDLGITNLLTREIAKDQARANRYLSGAIALKLILSILTLAILLAVVRLGNYPELVSQLIWVSVISMLMDSFTTLFFAVSRAFHNLKYESISAVASQLVTLAASLLILYYYHLGLVPLMWAQVASSFTALIIAASIIAWRWRLSFRPLWQIAWLKNLLLLSLPFGIYAIAQRLYTYFDSVLLYRLAGDSAVGIYQIPFRITAAFQFLPMAFIASLYPALSSYWRNNRSQLTITFERAINYSLIIAIPLSIGLAALAAPIVSIFQAGFSQAVLPLQISSLTVLFMFLNYPVGSLLNACDQQKANTINMIIATATSIILNLILIPKFGVMGAIWTAVITTFLLFILNWRTAKKIVKEKLNSVRRLLPRVLIASLLMAAAVYWLNGRLNLFVVVLIGAIVYFVSLFLAGGFKKEDVGSIMKSFKR